jgi:hypothetical protein
MLPENRLPVLGEVRDVLTSAWGPKYGIGMVNQRVLSDEPAETLLKAVRSKPKDLQKIQANVEAYLAEAKRQRGAATKSKDKPKTKRVKAGLWLCAGGRVFRRDVTLLALTTARVIARRSYGLRA